MKFICKFDNQEFEAEDDFKKHLRKHKLKLSDYFNQYNPMYDLYDLTRIEYNGDIKNYLNTYFKNRENLINYFKLKKDINLANRIFKFRKESKNLKFAPSQFELKTSVMPSISLLEHMGINYYEFCKSLEMEVRYKYDKINLESRHKDLHIFVDTREQQPLIFKTSNSKNKLDFGDYTAADKYYSGVFIERKNLSDLFSTLSGGFERFKKEIVRSKTFNSYIIVVIEGNIDHFNKFVPVGKTNPAFIGHRSRDILQEFNNIQFVFGGSRIDCSKLIENILSNGHEAKHVDWQYLLDSKKLNFN